MNRMIAFVIVVGLTITGLAISFYGSYVIAQGFETHRGTINAGDTMEIISELDPQTSPNAVYVVQVLNFNQEEDTGYISARVFDPFGSQIVFTDVESDSHEDQFEIVSEGEYRLLIENSGNVQAEIETVLGHYPTESELLINSIGIYILLAGMIGMVAVAIHVIIMKRKGSQFR